MLVVLLLLAHKLTATDPRDGAGASLFGILKGEEVNLHINRIAVAASTAEQTHTHYRPITPSAFVQLAITCFIRSPLDTLVDPWSIREGATYHCIENHWTYTHVQTEDTKSLSLLPLNAG